MAANTPTSTRLNCCCCCYSPVRLAKVKVENLSTCQRTSPMRRFASEKERLLHTVCGTTRNTISIYCLLKGSLGRYHQRQNICNSVRKITKGLHSSTTLVSKQRNAVNVKFECRCKEKQCLLYYTIRKLKHVIYRENTKAPTGPVYLDIDKSSVNRKQSTQWSKDAVFSWCSPQGQALAAQG